MKKGNAIECSDLQGVTDALCRILERLVRLAEDLECQVNDLQYQINVRKAISEAKEPKFGRYL